MNSYVRMPFEGIATFFGVPLLKDIEDLKENNVAIVGIPYDMGTTNKSGTRLAPRTIREASLLYTYNSAGIFSIYNSNKEFQGLWDINKKKYILKGLIMYDLGDISIVPANVEKSFKNIKEAVSLIIVKKAFPVFLGGDHSITYPILQAYENVENIHIIHFDTHIDTWENVGQAELGHGSPFFLAQNLKNIKRITHIGLHGFLNDEDRYIDAINKGHNVITAEEIHYKMEGINWKKLLPEEDNYYLSIDIDVCDPAYAPATGTAEFGGLTPVQLFEIINKICTLRKFIGMDLVEVCPLLDHSNITSLLACQIIISVLSAINQ